MAKKPKKEEDIKSETKEEVSETQKAPMLSVLAQYTKDQSFENPNAPDSLRSGLSAPEIQINIEIGRQMLEGDNIEVTLMLKAEAKRDDKIAFIAELEYAGLFAFAGVSAEEIQPLIMIECPRLLFPFSRQIMAEMTQNGGFPPIMLEPPDFAGMFRDEMMRRAAEKPVN
ncbi:MAG: protein-export chaperone SecB [Hellea sp.]|nr:protein-export chaperone SecB [Hellea sp.]MDG1522345.1 protein-export chaperone SecB [Hellea sp.]MDG1665781.1 protein-export chaperone SecB [Hellea sp.]MDG2362037.1 protein-export chaperone SecB [Hellea sp.]